MEIKVRCKGRWNKETELISLFLLIIKTFFSPMALIYIKTSPSTYVVCKKYACLVIKKVSW